MKSKMSFFNKGLIFSNIKRYSWVSAVWGVLLFLSVPLTLMTYDISNLNRVYEITYQEFINRFGGVFANLMLCAFPILIGMLMFRYLHSQKSSTVLHGLPFTRLRLFANSVLSGLILMLSALLLNTAIIIIIKLSMPIGNYITYTIIFTWLLNSVCIAICLFGLTVFVAMFTGNIIANLIFPYIIHFLPILLWLSIDEVLSSLVYGYSSVQVPEFMTKFPMIYFTQNSIACDIAYILSGIILFATAYIVYRKRPAESAGDIVSFKFIRPIFKYGTTFCTAIFGYLFLSGITGRDQSIISALVFLIIGYAIAQMLLTKSWRAWEGWKGLIISIVIALAFWGSIQIDITGFERRIPELENIQSITIINGLPGMDNHDLEIKGKDDIAHIHAMHESLSKNSVYKNYRGNFTEPTYTLSFVYTLNDGKSIKRSYKYIMKEYENNIKPLYYSEQIREQGIAILGVNADEIKEITISTYEDQGQGYKPYYIVEEQQISTFLESYKADLRKITFEDLVYHDYKNRFADVSFELYKKQQTKKTISPLYAQAEFYVDISYRVYEITNKFTNTIEWLEENLFN